jgi:DNA polymerase-3 subunit gamma/tau
MGTVPNAVFERLMEAISEGQTQTVILELNRLLNAGNSASQLARQFVRYLRNVLMARIAGENSDLLQISPDERARATRSASLFSEEDLTRFLQVMLRTFDELNYRQEQRFHLELGLIKLVHLTRLLPIEDLLSKLPAPPAGSRPGGGASSPGGLKSSPVSTRSATVPPSRAPRTIEPSKPAFSPFESDRNRKITGEVPKELPDTSVPVPQSVSSASVIPDRVVPEPAVENPVSAESRLAGALETVAARTSVQINSTSPSISPIKPPIAVPEVVTETTSGALALAPEPEAGDPSGPLDLDSVRDTVCSALEAQGHSTAAVLLSNGQWRQKGASIEVEVGIKKTMLGLTMNAEAEKICKGALRAIGINHKLSFIPGEAASSGPRLASNPKPAAAGSIQAVALENPLVRQAQEFFQAEVRSVLDLRK